MDRAEKLRCLNQWLKKFPFIAMHIDMSYIDYIKNIDALCKSLVKDCYLVKHLKNVLHIDTEMTTVWENRVLKIDLKMLGTKGIMRKVDTKYVNLKKDGTTYFEWYKNINSCADWLLYFVSNSKDNVQIVWILDRKGCLKDLAGKPQRCGQSGDILVDFSLEDIADCHKRVTKLEGVFKGLDF